MCPALRAAGSSRTAGQSGARLKIHRASYHIHKPSPSSPPFSFSPTSSSTSSTSSSTSSSHPAKARATHPHHPVIIYAQAPKVIHTPAADFMALVQKLTGLSDSNGDGGGGIF